MYTLCLSYYWCEKELDFFKTLHNERHKRKKCSAMIHQVEFLDWKTKYHFRSLEKLSGCSLLTFIEKTKKEERQILVNILQ